MIGAEEVTKGDEKGGSGRKEEDREGRRGEREMGDGNLGWGNVHILRKRQGEMKWGKANGETRDLNERETGRVKKGEETGNKGRQRRQRIGRVYKRRE